MTGTRVESFMASNKEDSSQVFLLLPRRLVNLRQLTAKHYKTSGTWKKPDKSEPRWTGTRVRTSFHNIKQGCL